MMNSLYLYAFLIKRTVYNMLDNFIFLLAINGLTMTMWAGVLYLIMVMKGYFIYPIIIGFILQNIINIIVLNVLLKINRGIGAYAPSLREKKEGEELKRKVLFITRGFQLGFLNIVITLMVGLSINFYLIQKSLEMNMLGLVGGWILLGWFTLTMFVALEIVKNRIGIFKAIKSSTELAVKNIWSSILIFIIFVGLTVSNVFFLPGVTTGLILLVAYYEALLVKEQYLSKNKMEKYLWKNVLKEENKKLGNRNLSEMLFPWKIKK